MVINVEHYILDLDHDYPSKSVILGIFALSSGKNQKNGPKPFLISDNIQNFFQIKTI